LRGKSDGQESTGAASGRREGVLSKNSNEFDILWAIFGEIALNAPEIADVFGGGGSCAAAEKMPLSWGKSGGCTCFLSVFRGLSVRFS
jgi:hypothetical protein